MHRTERNCVVAFIGNYIGYVNAQHKHHDLTLSRIKRDEKDVPSVMEVMTNTFIDLLSDNDLLCISNGLAATQSIAQDPQQAKQRGEEALRAFISDRLSDESQVLIYGLSAPDEVRIYDTFFIDIFCSFDIFLMNSSNCILIPNNETLNH